MPTEPIDVSVLVPFLNEELHLRTAAQAMLAQDFDGAIEFLFIDGGSTDRSRSILEGLAAVDRRVSILDNPARRTPQALNLGLARARGEFIARMDAHTVYPRRYLALGVQRLRRGDVASVSGPQTAVGANPGSRRVALALRTSLGTGGAGFRRELKGETEVDSGFTGLWRSSLLKAHGGWDEEFANDQDLELAARIRRGGGRIVCIPEMAASYIPRETVAALARQYMRYGTYRVKTTRRHPQSLRRSQMLPPALVTTMLAAVAAPSLAVRRAGRAGLAGYSATLLLAATRVAADGNGLQAAGLPGIWATMHLSYGLGFLNGCTRFGLPTAGIRHVLGRRPSGATSARQP